jgi:hypothetical protein|tara:strand:+ start:54 stop:401 length:348 start_codon:yes stop_codon:yes gene_type:complete
MAVQAAVPSHGGEVLAVFVKDANEKLCAPASNFLGMNCAGAGSMELGFEKVDGTLGETLVTLTVTDADGVGFKRAAQAVANALAGGHMAGKYVKIADTSTGAFIHSDITAVASIA